MYDLQEDVDDELYSYVGSDDQNDPIYSKKSWVL